MKSPENSFLGRRNVEERVSTEGPDTIPVEAITAEDMIDGGIDRLHYTEGRVLSEIDTKLGEVLKLTGTQNEPEVDSSEKENLTAKIQIIKSKIRELSQRTRTQIESLLGTKEYELDVDDPRAMATTINIAETLIEFNLGESIEWGKLLPKQTLQIGGAYIENQQVDLIQDHDGGLKIYFKLNHPLKKLNESHGGRITYGTDELPPEFGYQIDSFEKSIDIGTLKVAASSKFLATQGLVEISIPPEKAASLEADALHIQLAEIFHKELRIPNGTLEPSVEDVNAFKKKQYAEHHKLTSIPDKIEEKLLRKEVAPGYLTFVEEGKFAEYGKQGENVIYHKISRFNHIVEILKTGALISTHERYRRGMLVDGLSSSSDMESGTANKVFTRMLTKEGIQKRGIEDKQFLGWDDAVIIFKPQLLDRTDWYAYPSDSISTNEKLANKKLSPEEFFTNQKESFSTSNEQLFGTGISTSEIKAIAVADENAAKRLRENLAAQGILEINGIPIGDVIKVAATYGAVLST